MPPELIRFDRIPFTELRNQSLKFGAQWLTAMRAGTSSSDSHNQKLRASQEANWALHQLLAKLRERVYVFGSREDLLKAVPADTRLALTPLDDLFKMSVFNRELAKVLEKGNVKYWNAFSFDPKEKNFRLERATGLEQAQMIYPIADVSKKFEADGRMSFKVRAPASSNSLPDLSIDTSYLNGSFFGAKKGPYPFGKFVNPNEVFVDEKGQSHFDGDGHKHSHGGHGHKH
jgi:hypothetical protein